MDVTGWISQAVARVMPFLASDAVLSARPAASESNSSQPGDRDVVLGVRAPGSHRVDQSTPLLGHDPPPLRRDDGDDPVAAVEDVGAGREVEDRVVVGAGSGSGSSSSPGRRPERRGRRP